MIVRNAKIEDVLRINALITEFAEREQMLFRSLADIFENLQSFFVAEHDSSVVGCCQLQVIWSDLAEIKSLAVDKSRLNAGIGTALVKSALSSAGQLGIKHVFALTLQPDFFKKNGFEIIDKEQLPMKVWSDCARCPKQDNCDEIAMLIEVNSN